MLEVSAPSLPLILPSILVFPRLCQETTWKDLISRVGAVVLGSPVLSNNALESSLAVPRDTAERGWPP